MWRLIGVVPLLLGLTLAACGGESAPSSDLETTPPAMTMPAATSIPATAPADDALTEAPETATLPPQETPAVAAATAEATNPPSTVESGEQVSDQQFEFVPAWQQGDRRTIQLVKERVQTGGEGPSPGMATTPIEITVLEATDDGYLLSWSFGETQLSNEAAAAQPLVTALLGLTNGMRIDFETGRDGAFARLRNADEVKALAEEAIGRILEGLEQSGLPEDQLAGMAQQLETMTSSQQQLETNFTREIQLYHVAYGETYQLSQPNTYEGDLPNFLGGDPFPSTGEFVLTEYEPAGGRAVIDWTQTVDQERAKGILFETMQQMAERMGTSPPTESDIPSPFEIQDTAQFSVDTNTGWLRSLDHQRSIVSGPAELTETTKIEDQTE